MKKKGLVRLFALASCVSLLAGCGKDDPKLAVKDLPETFHIGDVIDLDKFVSVEGSNKSFEVYLYKASRDIATLKDHKITVKGEGQIKFEVSVGEESEIIKVSSVSEMREQLIKILGGYTDGYTIFGQRGDVYVHNAEYAERIFAEYSAQKYARYGFLSPNFSDATYEFSWEEGSEMSVNPKISAKSAIESYQYLNVDMTLPTREIVNDVELFTLSDKQIKSFVQTVLLSSSDSFPVSIPVDGSGKYDASSSTYAEVASKVTKVSFTLTEAEGVLTPAAVVYAKYGTSTFVADALFFTNIESEQYDDEEIRDVISSKHIPISTSYKDYFKFVICDYLPVSGAYVANFKYGWFDGSWNRIETQDTTGTIFEGVPVGETTRVFKADAIVDVVENEIVSGLAQHTEDEVTTVYHINKGASGHEKSAEEEFETVYSDQYSSLAYLVSDASFADDMVYLSKTKDGGTSEDTSDDIYVFGVNLKRHYDFMDGICTCEDNLSILCSILYKYLSQGRDFYSYFSFSLEASAAGEINCSFRINWEKGVYYGVSFSLYEDSAGTYDSLVSDLLSELFA